MLAEAAALVAALAAASPAAGPPTLDLRPRVLKLGRGESARVVVRAASPPRLVTSAGTLGPLRETAPGIYEAELRPPAATYPQLALVAAIGEDGVAFSCLPLVGRGVAIARTDPHARISVRIRDREFGPVVADGNGEAHVPVEVPPGERFAWHRDRRLDLGVPPAARLHVALGAESAPAQPESEVQVYAFAATEHGAPWAGAPLELAADAGTLGAPREVAPGAFVASWRLPPGAAGLATVEARAGDAGAARAALRRVAELPAAIAPRHEAPRTVASPPAAPQEPRRWLTATLRAGALHAIGGYTAPYARGAVEAWPRALGGRYGVALGLARAAARRDERPLVGDARGAFEGASTLWPLEVTALARRALAPRLTAVAGAGIGIVGIRSDVALDGVRSREWGTAPGVHATAGVARELPALRGRVSLDALLGWQDDPGMRTLRGSMGTLAIAVGVSHDAL